MIPDLREGHIGEVLFSMVVKKSNTSDVHVSKIQQCSAEWKINTDYYPELALLAPTEIGGGYLFNFAFTLQPVEYDL